MFKRERLFDCLTKSVSVLYVTGIIADPRVENIIKRVLSQKQITEKSNAFCISIINPHTS